MTLAIDVADKKKKKRRGKKRCKPGASKRRAKHAKAEAGKVTEDNQSSNDD